MKKIISLATGCALVACGALSFTACGGGSSAGGGSTENTQTSPVTLVAISGEQVGTMSDMGYYVVAEPAASTKVNALASLNFVGDLQQLYGGENGYPQAVIVAKNSLITGSCFINQFLSAVERNAEWLLDESTSAESIVSAISSHLTDGMSATFNSKNLTKQVIQNCGISLTYSKDCKTQISQFMEQINSVSQTSFGSPADEFFYDGNCGEGDYYGDVTVYAPDGAPALGLAKLMAGEESFTANVSYNVVAASTIQTCVTGTNPSADICVLPVNLATKLLGSGQTYSLVGTLTHGNLFLVSSSTTQITAQNINTLGGKRVGVVNLSAVPGLTLELILKNYGLEYVIEQ